MSSKQDAAARNAERAKEADAQLTELEKAVKAGQISIGAALARAVMLGAKLQRESE